MKHLAAWQRVESKEDSKAKMSNMSQQDSGSKRAMMKNLNVLHIFVSIWPPKTTETSAFYPKSHSS
jgi:hypothetical protein